jgi:trans-aconitate 2-methyltransferase
MPESVHPWNPADYARHSQGQQRWARELLSSLNLQPYESVLDVGCGDGRITSEIANLVPAGQALGVDRSAAMVDFAAQHFPAGKFPNLSFQTADAAALPFRSEFDFVYSSAALHWVRDHRLVLAGIARSLRPGGRCLLQMGGKGNGVGVVEAFERAGARLSEFPYAFYGDHEYRPLLEEAGLIVDWVELVPKDMVHPHRQAFTGWIRTAWLPYHQHISEAGKGEFLESVTDRFAEAHPADAAGAFHVRMVRLQVRGHRLA